ncbi:MAG TPA: hypothetical protein VM425_16385 [Myxococcota bacterium]|nr:hypothetical protein [Myxococcota bacterium]
MKGKCTEIEREIVAAMGAGLNQAVMEHIGQCESCARLHADALCLAGYRDRPALSSEAAVDLARSALRNERSQKPKLWVFPLLSASASAALLILHLGLASAPSPAVITGVDDGTGATLAGSLLSVLSKSYKAPLPDLLQAVNEMLFIRSDQEDDS